MTAVASSRAQGDWRWIAQGLIDDARFLEAVETVQNASLTPEGRPEAARLLDFALSAIAAGPAELVHWELRVLSAPAEPD